MKSQLFKSLLTKITNGTASDEELLLYHQWYKQELQEKLDPEEWKDAREGMSKEVYSRVLDQLSEKDSLEMELSNETVQRKIHWYKWLAVASMLLVAFLGYYHFSRSNPMKDIEKQYANTASDTSGVVMLTLANGEKLNLINTSEEELERKMGLKISKNGDEVRYEFMGEASAKEDEPLTYNTLYTSAGKTYHIILVDGSEVWLNAGSMLRFPTKFSGIDRQVQLIGEGYFEIKSMPNKPFIVASRGQEIEVKGTKFNVAAYPDDEFVRSTLLEGKVAVRNLQTDQVIQLTAGEQVTLTKDSFQKHKVAAQEAIGWKSGVLYFQQERLGDICKVLSRWYNIDFDASENPKVLNQRFSGTVLRFEKVEDVLAILSETGALHYKCDGRRILLME